MKFKHEPSDPSPIEIFFQESIHTVLHHDLRSPEPEIVERYLASTLAGFLRQESIFRIQDAGGKRVTSVTEMLEYADVRLKANSFNDERTVHRYIGDLLLFWSGIFPEFLTKMTAIGSKDMLLDCDRQGQESYYVVSTFDHDPFEVEAPLFRHLSEKFPVYRECLMRVRNSCQGFPGFSA